MRVILTLALVFVLSVPALAQSRKELAAEAALLEQRISELENRFLTGDPAAERLLRRMDALETEQRALRGEVEQLRYERDQMRKDMELMAAKISRFEAMEGRIVQHLEAVDLAAKEAASRPAPLDPYTVPGAVVPGPAPAQNAPSVPSAAPGSLGGQTMDMSELLDIGQQKLLSGDFAGAELAYQQYVNLNPNADDIDTAHYWLAETYMVRGRYADAARSYGASLDARTDGPNAPSAVIGLASAMRAMGNIDGACQTLSILPSEFPNLPADLSAKAAAEQARAGC